jgi:hypothetical protein
MSQTKQMERDEREACLWHEVMLQEEEEERLREAFLFEFREGFVNTPMEER